MLVTVVPLTPWPPLPVAGEGERCAPRLAPADVHSTVTLFAKLRG